MPTVRGGVAVAPAAPTTKKILLVKKPAQTTFVIYAKDMRQCSGILGTLDIYRIRFLLVGGTKLLEEAIPAGKDPVQWYSALLEQQDIYILKGSLDKKGVAWLEVDETKTPIDEFASWRDESISADDLAWRTYWIPCKSGTTDEAIGFWVSAKEERLGSMTVASLVSRIISSPSP